MEKIRLYSLVIFVMLFWGLNLVALKVLVEFFPPLTMTAIRIFIAGAFLMFILGCLRKLRKPSKQEFVAIIYATMLGVVLHHSLLSFGLAETTAIKGGIILGFSPLLTAILAILFGFTKISLSRFFGFILGAIGVTISVINGSQGIEHLQIGDLFIFLSILSQSCSFLLISTLSKTLDAIVLTAYMLFFGSLILLIVSVITEPIKFIAFTNASVEMLGLLFASAILATAVGHVAYNYAISSLGAAETAIFGNFNTVFGLLGTSIILKENISSLQIVGCILIIIGVLIGTGAMEAILYRRKDKEFAVGNSKLTEENIKNDMRI